MCGKGRYNVYRNLTEIAICLFHSIYKAGIRRSRRMDRLLLEMTKNEKTGNVEDVDLQYSCELYTQIKLIGMLLISIIDCCGFIN